MNEVTIAFLLTMFAGLATGIGGLIVVFSKTTSRKFLSICLSFAAGVMIYISFAEVLFGAFNDMEEMFYYDGVNHYAGLSALIITAAFFGGILIMAVIDKFIPQDEEVVEMLDSETNDDLEKQYTLAEKKSLKRTGVLSTLAVSIHNLPEGLIVFMAALIDSSMGVGIAIAIAIHNIPEGIAIAAPIYYATGSKAKALGYSILSGLTEPLGALLAWLLFLQIFDYVADIFAIIFAVIGGIMVFVAIHQLLPAAQKYGKHHSVMKWLFYGMAFMAASLVLLDFVF